MVQQKRNISSASIITIQGLPPPKKEKKKKKTGTKKEKHKHHPGNFSFLICFIKQEF
jgi:hypothetical protein